MAPRPAFLVSLKPRFLESAAAFLALDCPTDLLTVLLVFFTGVFFLGAERLVSFLLDFITSSKLLLG